MIYDWQNYTVLVTEDDEISFRYIELVLSRKTNINVIWAINGKQAVEYCELYDHIDIVLMDIQLPEINGYEATKLIKSSKPNLPIIIQTANSLNKDLDKCVEAGCDGYVIKPIDLPTLFDKINNCLKTVPSN